jgi:hypothetical protein
MLQRVLWRRLTETDFNAMNGKASSSGSGGGAMHVSLGVSTPSFPVDAFLSASGRTVVPIETQASPGHVSGLLTFSSNPGRRGGEWLIRDQYTHRHPSWSAAAGFPLKYDASNPPYVFLFKIGSRYLARLSDERSLKKLAGASAFISIPKGIKDAPNDFLSAMGVPTAKLIDAFEAITPPSAPFDPKNILDGRKKIFAEVFRRQGQQLFRRELLKAYGNRCCMTGCKTIWVLEAAHIVPYRGKATNDVANGLILRSDVHTLFDVGLVTVHPSSRSIVVSKDLGKSAYAKMHGKSLQEPIDPKMRPPSTVLDYHFKLFKP